MEKVTKTIDISQQLKELIASAVNASFEGQNMTSEAISLEHPGAEEHGDYSTNVALKIQIPGLKPREVAEKIVAEMDQSVSRDSTDLVTDDTDIVEKVEVAGPGFVNFYLSGKWRVEQVGLVSVGKEEYGKGYLYAGKKVMLEFTDPNPFKEFHIGHVYTNTVGESLSRLFESQGAEVWRVNYEGDVGLHVAKAVWGIQKSLSEMPNESVNPSEKANYLGKAYALGAKSYGESEEIKKEIDALNKKIYEQDKSVMEIYEKGKKWSLDYFESLYRVLGTEFKRYYFESEAGEVGLKLVKENIGKVFEESEGAVIFPGEKYGLHNRVFINSAGLPTYEAKEVGLAPTKYKDFNYDLSFIITGNEINEYFKVLIKALSFIYPDLAAKTTHIGHGMVRLPEGKMSSRTGKVITGEWLIGEMERMALERVKEKSPDLEDEQVPRKVAVGAIKYAFLKSEIGSDLVFDLGKSVDFEGDSGPYLQYTYARARSVLRKSKDKGLRSKAQGNDLELSKEELAILRWLYRFPEVVENAAKNYSPNLIASYLFELAKRFNNFYNNIPILQVSQVEAGKSTNEQVKNFRLAVTEATSIVLKNGLNLLGIEALERM